MEAPPEETPVGALAEPPVADAEAATFRLLHPDALKVALLAGAITYVSIIAPVTVGLAIALLFVGVFTIGAMILVLAWVVVAGGLGLLCFGWPRLAHRHVSYRADERGLQIRRGVLWRSHLFVARSRIQHTDVAQGPLQRRLGLGRLVVHTAGTHNASTTLSGIAFEEARQIRETLTVDDSARGDGV